MVQIFRFRWLFLIVSSLLFAYGLTRGLTNSLFAGACLLLLCWYRAGEIKPVTGWVRWPVTIIVPILLLALLASDESADLRVELDPPFVVQVTNVGRGPVVITGAQVNDRDDCRTNGLFGTTLQWPQTLKVGEFRFIAAPCQVVRIKIHTTSGTHSFSFSR